MNEAHMHPPGNQRRLSGDDGRQKRKIRILCAGDLRIVTRNGKVRQLAHLVLLCARGKELEGAHPQMARRHPGQNSPVLRPVALDFLPGCHGGQCPSGRDTKRMHRFAHQVFAQHRAKYRFAVASARKRRPPRSFQLNIPAHAILADHLPQKQRPTIPKLRRKVTELVPRIDLCQRDRPIGCHRAGKTTCAPASADKADTFRPSSCASAALKTSISGAGASSPSHGT